MVDAEVTQSPKSVLKQGIGHWDNAQHLNLGKGSTRGTARLYSDLAIPYLKS